MAFKGTWHRAEGGGGGSASGDRRYTSSNDSYSSFVLPPQGVPGNQIGLGTMNYQTNPNNMYSVMNTVSRMEVFTPEKNICRYFLGPIHDARNELFIG